MLARLLAACAFCILSLAAAPPSMALRGDGVTVERAWARASPGGATTGGAYLEIFGDEKSSDRLIGISSPAAGRAEIHSHAQVDGVMKMRKLEAIDIAAGASHLLAPGGDHIMLFDLKTPLHQGADLALTLTFEKAGIVKTVAKVLWIGAKGPGQAPPAAGSDDGPESGSGSDDGSGSDSGSHE